MPFFSTNSCESVRTFVNIGQLPYVSSPVAIQAELLNTKNEMENEILNALSLFEVGQPFWVRFTLWNCSGRERALPIQICFEQTEGLLLAGIKEVGPIQPYAA